MKHMAAVWYSTQLFLVFKVLKADSTILMLRVLCLAECDVIQHGHVIFHYVFDLLKLNTRVFLEMLPSSKPAPPVNLNKDDS